MAEHQTMKCLYGEISCPFNKAGCDFKVCALKTPQNEKLKVKVVTFIFIIKTKLFVVFRLDIKMQNGGAHN